MSAQESRSAQSSRAFEGCPKLLCPGLQVPHSLKWSHPHRPRQATNGPHDAFTGSPPPPSLCAILLVHSCFDPHLAGQPKNHSSSTSVFIFFFFLLCFAHTSSNDESSGLETMSRWSITDKQAFEDVGVVWSCELTIVSTMASDDPLRFRVRVCFVGAPRARRWRVLE